MKITFAAPKGMVPKFHPQQLADGYSVLALNMKTGREAFEPFQAATEIHTLTNASIKSVYNYRHRLNGYSDDWLEWSGDKISAARVPLTNDPHDHLVIANPTGEPKIRRNGAPAEYDVGVPRPNAPSFVTAVDPAWQAELDAMTAEEKPTEDQLDKSQTSYVVAYVDAWDRVGPLSDPSNSELITEYQFRNTTQCTVTLPVPPIGDHVPLAKFRLYRANYASGGQGVYQFVADIAISETTFVDLTFSGDLEDAPFSDDWIGPPDNDTATYPNGPLKKVVAVAATFLAGHNDRIVAMSEPNTTHAWPVRYYQVVKEKIVTISPAGQSLVVLTDGFPYVMQGVHPEAMSPVRLADQVPCANPCAVTEVNDAVYYASSHGLYVITGFRLENVSKHFMTSLQWKAMQPSTMIMANYDGNVYIYSQAQDKTFTFDPQNPQDGFRETTLTGVKAFYQLEETNELVAVVGDKLVKWDADETLSSSMSWESKEYNFHSPICFSVAKVTAENYPTSVTFECTKQDGSVEQYTKTVNDDQFFYLPFNNRARKWRAKHIHSPLANPPMIRLIEMGQDPSEFI